MKNLFFIIMLTLFCSACKAQNTPKIKISYVNLDITTPITIKCDDFERLFNSKIKTVIIDKKTDINSLINMVNNLKIDTSKYMPDVRVKLEISYSDTSKIYCLSKMRVYSEGITYFLPDKLLGILKRYMKYVELSSLP